MQFAFSTGISSEKEHGIVVSNSKNTVIEMYADCVQMYSNS